MGDYTILRAAEAPDYTGDAPGAFLGYGRPMGAEQLAFNVRVLAPHTANVPPGGDPGFVDAVLDIVRRENIDVVLPQSSFDLLGLAEARERFMATTVMVSPPEAVRTANDKAATYALLERLGLRAPAWRKVTGARALALAAQELGYPERPLCFKPVFSSGSRGYRVDAHS